VSVIIFFSNGQMFTPLLVLAYFELFLLTVMLYPLRCLVDCRNFSYSYTVCIELCCRL